MQSRAATVDEYLAELPADRRAELEAVRQVILANLDSEFEEGMQYGMIGYHVPHRIYPKGYHCDPMQPLPFAGLAAQKRHLSLYMMCIYGDGENATRFRDEWKKTGRKLDMGKACIRFQRADDLALDLIGRTIGGVTARGYIAFCEAALDSSRQARAERKASGGESSAKQSAAKRPAGKKPVRKLAAKKSSPKSRATVASPARKSKLSVKSPARPKRAKKSGK